jgi:hypothetical protein
MMERVATKATVASVLAAVTLAVTTAWAALSGVVPAAVTTRAITVSNAVYELHESTSFQDMTGRPISFSEVRPGVTVELEFDEEGRLTVIRAAVVR